MDQLANWVRFADAKATIMTAGLGVVFTILVSNAKVVMAAITADGPGALVVGILAALAVSDLLWTLSWLVRAIGPNSRVPADMINRFSWPTLARVSNGELATHLRQVDVREDVWNQVIALSQLADRKFSACGNAVWGFALLVVLGLACIAVAVAIA